MCSLNICTGPLNICTNFLNICTGSLKSGCHQIISPLSFAFCQSWIKLTGSIFGDDIFAPNQLSAVAVNCDLHTLYWRASSKSENQTMFGYGNSERENNLILFYIFVTGHWVAGRERFRAGGKIFSPFWELAICGRVWWAEQTGGGWSAVMPDGSYQADIMEDVAIWTETNFSCSNQPTYTWNQLQKYIRKNIGLWNKSDQINIVQDLDRDQVLCCNQPSPHLL